MIDSLQIKNFRCFRDLSLGGLKRFNVVVGASGSGKTALLESIFLAGGSNPELYLRMRSWRGLGESIRFSGLRAGYEALFRELFFDFKKEEGANIRFTDSDSGPRSLIIRYRSDDQMTLSLKGGTISSMAMDPLTFRWKIGDRSHDATVQIRDGNLTFTGFAEVYPIWLVSAAAPDATSEHFSELSKRNRHVSIIEAVRQVFRSISNLSLESIAGQLVICASLDYLEEKIPIGLVSGGLSKYLWMLVAIESNPGGVVLVDEIENGLYYKSLPLILESIASFAESHRVQIIATTHSKELLNCFAAVMRSREEHFSLLRTARDKKECNVHIARGPSAISAILQEIDLRG